MKAAILILAHQNLKQLKLLIARLADDFDVYIHIDKKWDVPDDSFRDYKNVFLTKRYRVNWGSYNQIRATYQLFKTSGAKRYDYYMLISGQDLPIKSNREILDFITANKNYSYMVYDKLPTKHWLDEGVDNGGIDRIAYYWPDNIKPDKFGVLCMRAVYKLQHLQRRFNIKRRLHTLPYYGGWNWCNLNKEAVDNILSFIKEHPSFFRHFKHTHCADEIWLQTILMNTSPCNIINDNLRYVTWQQGDYSPKTLTMNDLNDIRQSQALFARKFDDISDISVINCIYSITT